MPQQTTWYVFTSFPPIYPAATHADIRAMMLWSQPWAKIAATGTLPALLGAKVPPHCRNVTIIDSEARAAAVYEQQPSHKFVCTRKIDFL